MAKRKIISDIKKFLVDEGIYTEKDELSLILLENTYNQYLIAYEDVKLNGPTLSQYDSNNNKRTVSNPSFKNYLELQKELFKLIDSLYLSPKSRKTKKEVVDESENPFTKMISDLNGTVEKR